MPEKKKKTALKKTPSAKKTPAKKAPAPKKETKGTKPLPKKPAKAARAPVPPETEEARKESLRRLLVKRREGIVKEAQSEIAKYIKGENRQLVETALDDGDWSVIDLSEDINLRKLGAHRQTLLKIDTALRKLREGTYGVCEDCGEEIEALRLKVLPFAVCCRDCQERREELEAIGRPASL